ncbi:glycosyltransferase family 2 protein [Clostridium manihotivorum]|uniref:Glycosyl transferase family 2 n=1 Tax=Clostridium manihotivorum TaxID=2320868 RepID=A0A3R5TEM7_9CLOT|nr:glycosyltransferase family 2 protein [Clostridium manihotivorum]QAA31617.1 glycosyl transferase family 2 [Clostridium manihotivorum]
MGNLFIYYVTKVFQSLVYTLTLYYLILSLFGLYRRKENKNYVPSKKFAMIVAAHNEEVVIANLIESLQHQDYPKELYDIFVIADNCTDKTAEIAAKHGAKVFERNNKEKRGKGYALEWMFDKIFKMDKKYDAVAIFDADNLVSPNFIKEMNSKMCDGYKVVQGYLDSKNPGDSWITQSYSVSFWSSNRAFQLARANLGLSNQIGGTGFAVDVEVLKTLGWGATCLTEDLEFTCKLVLNGEKVGWAHDAVVFDEKPLTLKDSWNQRKRWMQGFSDVASRFFVKLIKKAVKDRNFVAFDCALYVAQPFMTLLLAISLCITTLQSFQNASESFHFGFIQVFGMFQFLLTPFLLIQDKKFTKKFFAILVLYSTNVIIMPLVINAFGEKQYLIIAGMYLLFNVACILLTLVTMGKDSAWAFFRYLLYSIYTLTWVPITVQGILNRNNKEWSHTKHVRQIGIYDV